MSVTFTILQDTKPVRDLIHSLKTGCGVHLFRNPTASCVIRTDGTWNVSLENEDDSGGQFIPSITTEELAKWIHDEGWEEHTVGLT